MQISIAKKRELSILWHLFGVESYINTNVSGTLSDEQQPIKKNIPTTPGKYPRGKKFIISTANILTQRAVRKNFLRPFLSESLGRQIEPKAYPAK